MNKRFCDGLTLLELLVVTTIVVTLLSVVWASCSAIWQSGVRVACSSNLRQLGMAFQLYAQDFRGKLPHGDRDSDTGRNHCWFDCLDEFLAVKNLSTVKQCPAWQGYSSAGVTADRHSIKMNGALCSQERLPETFEGRKKGKWYWPRVWYLHPSTVLLVDGRMDAPFDTHTDTRIARPYQDTANRHQNGSNVLLLDGSVHYQAVERERTVGWGEPFHYIWEPYLVPENYAIFSKP